MVVVLTVSTSVLDRASPQNNRFSGVFNRKAWLTGCAFFAWFFAGLPASWADDCRLDKGLRDQLVRAQVARVIDGDSLVLASGEQVRLIGVNAPEKWQPLAQQAKAGLQTLLVDGEVYLLPGASGRDKYKRILANLFLSDGRNIEAVLLQQGLAFPVAIPPDLLLVDCHWRMAKSAQMAGKGVWQQYTVKSGRNLTQADTGFQRVSGKLLRIDEKGGHWWLQLDGPLVLRIAAEHQSYFDRALLDGGVGKTVLVTGWVVDRSRSVRSGKYSPLMLLLTHPAHIEVLYQ